MITSEKIISTRPDLNGEGGSYCRHLIAIDGQHADALQRQKVNAVPLAVIKTRTCTQRKITGKLVKSKLRL